MPRTFLIAPVRGYPWKHWSLVVGSLKADGWDVYWPARDTKQVDNTGGLRICEDNRAAIADSDCIHVIWDGKSAGCLFDLGMAFALEKEVHIIELPETTSSKSFQDMIRAWEQDR